MAQDVEARETGNSALVIGLVALVLIVGAIYFFGFRPAAEPVAVAPSSPTTTVVNPPAPSSTTIVNPPAPSSTVVVPGNSTSSSSTSTTETATSTKSDGASDAGGTSSTSAKGNSGG